MISDLMREWLESGDPVKVRHARMRLQLPSEPEPTRTELHPPPRPAYTPPARYAGPLPECLYASRGLAGSCNPVRCWANRGTTCGGTHATPGHCRQCLYGDRR